MSRESPVRDLEKYTPFGVPRNFIASIGGGIVEDKKILYKEKLKLDENHPEIRTKGFTPYGTPSDLELNTTPSDNLK